MDVRASAVPLYGVSLRVAQGHSARPKPAILRVCAANAVLRFVGFPGLHATHPVLEAGILVIGMKIVHPPQSCRRTRWRSRVFVESPADVVPATVRLTAEDNIGSGLHDGVQLLILFCQVAVELQQS